MPLCFPFLRKKKSPSPSGPCPADVKEPLLLILEAGLQEIRNSPDADSCRAMGQHLHNLPKLIRKYSPQRLDYYWEAERPPFIRRVGQKSLPPFAAAWQRLEPLVRRKKGE